MSRENAETKARRLLTEGRVIIEAVDAKHVVASVRGSGVLYVAGYQPGGWFCSCAAKGRCSHLLALQLITVAPPLRRAAS